MFEGFEPDVYKEEARERWGDTDAYRESTARTAGYGEREWSRIAAESEQIAADFASSMAAGLPAHGERAREIAERHREHISRWFYACSPDRHRGLGELYAADPRFAVNFERREPGLAAYVRDAIAAGATAYRPPAE